MLSAAMVVFGYRDIGDVTLARALEVSPRGGDVIP
jgi:hypothetical protein